MPSKLLFLSALAISLLPVLSQAQYRRDWARSVDGGMNLSDRSSDLITDSEGNIFLVGTVNSSSNDQFADAALFKFAPDGTLLWSKRFDGEAQSQDIGFDLALGGDGSVNVIGRTLSLSSSSDFITIKYRASDGQLLWSRTYDGPANSVDTGTDIVADDEGNVYVTGEVWNDAEFWPNGDWCTIKYSVDGTQQWVRLFDGPASYLGFNDDPQHITLDHNGDVIVAGNSPDSSNSTDMVVVKYAGGDGSTLWEHRYEPGGVVASLQVAPNNDIIVAGNTFQSDYKIVIERLDGETGVAQWDKVDVFPHHGQLVVPHSMVLDSSGNPILSLTYDPDADESNLNYNIQTTKYAFNSGDRIWSTSVGGTARFDGQEAQTLAVDAEGNVLVGGANLVVPHLKFSTWLFDGITGAMVWSDSYAFSADSDRPVNVVFDQEGNAIFTGNTTNNNNGYADMFLIKYLKERGARSMQTLRGTAVSGSLSSTQFSDNSYLVTGPGVVALGSEAPVQVMASTISPTVAPLSIAIHVEAKTSQLNISQTVQLFDFTTGRWVDVDSRPAQLTDQIVEVSPANPRRFVDSTTREVRCRISYRQTGPIISYPWKSSIDQLYWLIRD